MIYRLPYIFASLMAASGCLVGDPNVVTGEDPDPNDGTTTQGVITAPRHGQVFTEDTASIAIDVTGYATEPAMPVEIQVLAVPTDLASWTTIAQATADAAPATGTEAAPMYEFSATASPADWTFGGVLRMRAIDPDGSVLAVLDHDDETCITGDPATWREGIATCGVVGNGLVLVSPGESPADAIDPPLYLDRKGTNDALETQAYYTAINAPATLAAFITTFGFDGTESIATYYNAGDLGIGRQMHCKSIAAPNGPGVACYVSNFGEFGGDATLAVDEAVTAVQAGTSDGAFATVAMVYEPPATAPNSVKFMVYGPDDAGALITQAVLDTRGDNASIPNNCLNCHGGRGTYDAAANTVIDAKFLPFDPTAFGYSTISGFALADQQESIRELNALIATTTPTIGIREQIEGASATTGGRVSPGSTFDPEFVPADWTVSARTAQVYRQLVGPYCRNCHASMSRAGAEDILDFGDAALFTAQGANIGRTVCGTPGDGASHAMPNAEVVLDRLWASPARAYLVEYLDLATACAP
jgi:hypothetical protein